MPSGWSAVSSWRSDAASAAERQRCYLVFKLSTKLVRDGTGEGQPAHGFCIILADGRVLFATKPNGKPKLGKIMNPVLYDYRDKGLYLKDDKSSFNALCSLAHQDGAIVIDAETRQITCANYLVTNLDGGVQGKGGARHLAAARGARGGMLFLIS
mgnify:CR=1 FL=1